MPGASSEFPMVYEDVYEIDGFQHSSVRANLRIFQHPIAKLSRSTGSDASGGRRPLKVDFSGVARATTIVDGCGRSGCDD
jgi:hypothetical protein